MTKQVGFLLSYLKYGDNDAVIHAFTREKGYQTFFVKGIFSSRNKKSSYLIPLNELEFGFAKEPKAGRMALVNHLELVENPEFYSDVKCSTIVFFVAEFLNRNLQNEGVSEEIYTHILQFLDELERKNYTCHLVFLFQILKEFGFVPLLGDASYLNPEMGSFGAQQSHHLYNESISQIWKQLLETDEVYKVKIHSKLRRDFLESLLVYYHYHLPDFRMPQSLEIVQQLFVE